MRGRGRQGCSAARQRREREKHNHLITCFPFVQHSHLSPDQPVSPLSLEITPLCFCSCPEPLPDKQQRHTHISSSSTTTTTTTILIADRPYQSNPHLVPKHLTSQLGQGVNWVDGLFIPAEGQGKAVLWPQPICLSVCLSIYHSVSHACPSRREQASVIITHIECICGEQKLRCPKRDRRNGRG
jgi:hypothetical protein